jgi:ABC-type nitrate/sulfonate/bicarbonate transport system substrate-binding protein
MKIRSARGTTRWPVLVAIAVLAITAGVFVLKRPGTAPTGGLATQPAPQGQVALRVGHTPFSVNLPAVAAAESGAFAKAGFEVQLVRFESTDAMTTALMAGQIDVASTLAAEAVYTLNANKPDSPLRPFFLNEFRGDSKIDALVVGAQSTAAAPADLRGMKIGVLPASMMRVALLQYLATQKIQESEVTLVNLPPSTILTALGSGQVDAVYAFEPLVTISQAKLKARVIVSGLAAKGIVDPLPAGFHTVSKAYLDAHPGIEQKLVDAYVAGAAYAEDPKNTPGLLNRNAGIDPAIAGNVVLPRWGPLSDEVIPRLRAQFDALQPTMKWTNEVFDKTAYITRD